MTASSLQYCDCPDPVETAQQFCDTCGAAYQNAPAEFTDRLAVGAHLGAYRVTERHGMWALLEDGDGQLFRFWPTGDTALPGDRRAEQAPAEQAPAEPPAPHPAEQDAGAPSPETAPPDPPEVPLPDPAPEEDAPAATGPQTSECLEAPDVAPEENTGGDASVPDRTVDPVVSAEFGGSAEPGPVPGPPAAPPGPQGVPPPATPKPRHFTFLSATETVLDGVPGYLEVARPDKFTGTEARSLRALLDADPTGEDRPPARVLGWLVQCAQAMKSAHEQGLLVNSFTPDTVFVDYDAAASRPERIAISVALHAGPFGAAHRVAGYAPQGDEPLTPRTDVYQVGALLRDLLGWQPDKIGGEETEALLKGPMPLVRLLLSLMHPDPERRPASADALKKLIVDTQQAFASQHVLDVAGMTDAGLSREHNEDAFGFLQFEEHAGRGQLSTTVLVVCDGVGGSNAGEEASRLAVRELLSSLSAASGTAQSIPARLESALLQANTQLLALSAEHQGAGCTAAVVYVQGQEYWVAHAGDSRAYVCVDGVLQALTADHSWTAQQVRKGLLDPRRGQRARQRPHDLPLARRTGPPRSRGSAGRRPRLPAGGRLGVLAVHRRRQ